MRIKIERINERLEINTRLTEKLEGEEESYKGRTVNALAHRDDEGRDKLRKAMGRCK